MSRKIFNVGTKKPKIRRVTILDRNMKPRKDMIPHTVHVENIGIRKRMKRARSIMNSSMNKTLYYVPFTKLTHNDIINNGTKMINLSLDDMLSASHALSIYQNGRSLDLASYTRPVRDYVSQVIKDDNIDNGLIEINRQIAAKISEE